MTVPRYSDKELEEQKRESDAVKRKYRAQLKKGWEPPIVHEGRYGAWLEIPKHFPTSPDQEIFIPGIELIELEEQGGMREASRPPWEDLYYPAKIRVNMMSGRHFTIRCHHKLAEVVLLELRRIWRQHR